MKGVIILDWDDTLFPTSWTMKNGLDISDESKKDGNRMIFSRLDSVLHLLLLNLTKHYKVIIITNATEKWVRTSNIILPHSYKLIDRSIDIYSARDLYSSTNISPNNWKIEVFNDIMDTQYNYYNNILSVGDAEYEVMALANLYKKYKIIGKTLRFIDNPNYKQIIEQLEMFQANVKDIMDYKGLADLSFSELI